jgi:hypothetical protein
VLKSSLASLDAGTPIASDKKEKPLGQDQSTRDRARPRIVMADIWTQRVDPPLDPEAIVGFAVEARNAGVGEVDEAIEAGGIGRLIVDSESTMSRRKVLLPFGIIEHVDVDSRTVFLDRSKEEIESAPEFDPEVHRKDARYYELIGDHYAD